jgi:hypothetical protein
LLSLWKFRPGERLPLEGEEKGSSDWEGTEGGGGEGEGREREREEEEEASTIGGDTN